MRLIAHLIAKFRPLLIGGLVLFILVVGCSRQKRAISTAPTVLHIEHPSSLSDAELEEIAKCGYWGVCVFQHYEEMQAFGPNFLYDGLLKYVPKKRCRFKECERLEAFYHIPLD